MTLQQLRAMCEIVASDLHVSKAAKSQDMHLSLQ
jgi:hypothetical protein